MEIRDGRYGYSRLIGRYCDSNPLVLPLESSGKELWIKFNTDESIQHDGFKIVYEFKKFTRDLKSDFSSNLILAFFFVFRIRYVKVCFLECEILLTDFDFEKNASGVVTSYDIEKISARKLDDLKKIYSNKSLANSFRKYLDCTVHIQVKPSERVSKKKLI